MHVLGFSCLYHNDFLVAVKALHVRPLQHIGGDHYIRCLIEGDRPRYNAPFVEKTSRLDGLLIGGHLPEAGAHTH